jgi:hypothetical protein
VKRTDLDEALREPERPAPSLAANVGPGGYQSLAKALGPGRLRSVPERTIRDRLEEHRTSGFHQQVQLDQAKDRL